MVFGYGHLTWEWGSDKGIRGYLHPLLFSIVFWFLKLFGLDTPWLVAYSPRLVQGFLAAVGDFYVYKLARHLFGPKVAPYALFCQVVCWFNFYCLVRTYSNSVEAVLTIVAVYYWFKGQQSLALFLAAITCIFRPTAAVVWLYLGVAQLLSLSRRSLKQAFTLALQAVSIGVLVIGFSVLLDRYFYGSWQFPIWSTLKFNLLESGASFYGVHPFHWYFTAAVPFMTISLLPLLIGGPILALIDLTGRPSDAAARRDILVAVLCSVLLYSLSAHKEFRFILPQLLLMMPFCGYALYIIHVKLMPSSLLSKSKPHSSFLLPSSISSLALPIRFLLLLVILSHIIMGGYLSVLHQSAPEQALAVLREEAASGALKSAHFWTPCHATPYYSFLHRPVPMRFLDCSPNLDPSYVAQSVRFFQDPTATLNEVYPPESLPDSLPSHIVLWGSALSRVQSFLDRYSYQKTHTLFHSHFTNGSPYGVEYNSNFLIFRRQA
eukprot:GILI01009585.1.p1 GENE.GILI01009585.1~~GILI01009585.1.p1  ORF type:complete len:544 (-),score=100.96 GILI01009585.1:316-1788(-)